MSIPIEITKSIKKLIAKDLWMHTNAQYLQKSRHYSSIYGYNFLFSFNIFINSSCWHYKTPIYLYFFY